MFASGVIIVEHKVCWIFPVDPGTIAAFYHVDAIVSTIKKTVNITHVSPFMAGGP
jgi:hypothetical protein